MSEILSAERVKLMPYDSTHHPIDNLHAIIASHEALRASNQRLRAALSIIENDSAEASCAPQRELDEVLTKIYVVAHASSGCDDTCPTKKSGNKIVDEGLKE